MMMGASAAIMKRGAPASAMSSSSRMIFLMRARGSSWVLKSSYKNKENANQCNQTTSTFFV